MLFPESALEGTMRTKRLPHLVNLRRDEASPPAPDTQTTEDVTGCHNSGQPSHHVRTAPISSFLR
ncbi:MAG: hypothetical protein J9259_00215 [Thermoplasmata archaeon YP2-bin.285]|uniref:Uncharacterized protein n=1 Tax=Candidatus Sysuiplasma superficiale TaxID=2823368 RepID=A0A8J7YID8_9ARCH|nr:hypothetical protein [Candidatus Sysuiplasma superficiale]